MFGRAIFGNPWLFNSPPAPLFDKKEMTESGVKNIKKKLKVLIEHTRLFEKMLGKHKNFAVMKKHFKAYVNGFDGSKELRTKLMETKNAKEVEKIINDFLRKI